MATNSSLKSWLARAVIEGALIVFAVVLGFVVNEWREDVSDRRAAEAAMNRVVAEIETNIAQLEAVVDYHEAVVERIDERLAEIEAAGEPVRGIPFDEYPELLPRGVNAPGLSDFAWAHAQEHGRLDVLPYDLVAATARTYGMQASGVEATWRQIVELLFAGPQVMREQDVEASLRFTQIGFTELASQERFLIDQYRRVLEALRASGLGREEASQ
ncbi:hypothetical protein [Maricaulis sp.]|uniref:hypothetical protein n=1 Tax=Maricaulis sp. TaxID=1486257 RepID=UPI0026326DEE|nr:hypothetical protein [Maricaulis sp.]